MGPRLLAEALAQVVEGGQPFTGGRLTAEGQEHLERGRPGGVVELDAEGIDSVEMSGLDYREGGGQLAPADVQVERLALDVEELAPGAEAAKLSRDLAGHAAVGHDDVDLAQLLQGSNQLLP